MAEEDKNVMLLLKQLNLNIDAAVGRAVESKELTGAQGRLLGYLQEHRDEKLCSTDIHTRLHFSRASVSEMLKRLRQKEFVQFEMEPGDDRIKYIVLTPKAYELHRFMEQTFADIEERLYRDFSEEDKAEFLRLADKMLRNLKNS